MKATVPTGIMTSLLAFTLTHAIEVNHVVPPSKDANFAWAKFNCVVDDKIPKVRGVIVCTIGWNGDGTGESKGAGMREYAKKNQCALVGCALGSPKAEYVQATQGSGAALEEAIKELAQKSGKAEIATAPIYFWSQREGANFALHYLDWRPERVGALALLHCDPGQVRIGPKGRDVPVLLMMAAEESRGYARDLEAMLSYQRAHDAPWALGQRIRDADEKPMPFACHFLSEVMQLRGDSPQAGPLSSDLIQKGLIADFKTREITPAKESKVRNAKTAWFPGKESAAVWQQWNTP